MPPVTDLHVRLLAWFAASSRDLPWRSPDAGPWAVLVSEVMLQQTPVARVLPVWREWLERWPTAAHVAAASPAEVLQVWGGLGYPRRALRLLDCARDLVDRRQGQVPSLVDELRELPGVGEYTAAAVAAFAYRRRVVVLDTNVRRVLARLLGGEALPGPGVTAAERARAAGALPTDAETSARWNAALMELGALVCRARAPRCAACPVADACRWHAAGRPPDAHPSRRRGQAWHGTDRQARGALMALVRKSAATPVAEAVLAAAWPAGEQRARALSSLVVDGLVEAVAGGYRLPTARGAAVTVAASLAAAEPPTTAVGPDSALSLSCADA